MSKIAFILNFASYYRQNIFLDLEKELKCDFYFGNVDDGRIKKIDYTIFNNKVDEFNTIKLVHNFTWMRGTLSLLFKPYEKYILTGEPYSVSTWCFLILNKLIGKKTYLWTHGWYGNEGRIKTVIKYFFYKLSDGLFLYGDYAKGLMLKEGFKEDELHVIYNSLDYNKQLEVRNNLKESNIYTNHFKNEYKTLLFIGRLTPVKKLHQILEVVSNLKKKNKYVNVVFLGDGLEKNRLIDLSKELGIEKNCWFYGAVYDELVISEFIFNADLCVSPGNVGLTAIHALMYGLPVVTHNNLPNQMPEFEVIKEGITGCYFEEDNLLELELKISQWLERGKDRESTRKSCYKIIDNNYNPNYQKKIFKEILV
jgi:glycosyltransferase involved in cell wall biosynthesis